ncbi:L-asparaginase 1 [Pseudomonas alcaligenes]|uniref:L-asparaginase 1 n=1 Tax=Aquipseudomonas alcaligenes TaxID=43263 RepID=A0ABR7RUD5_AQUAC|nr:asparaginase [Pseudomonas alcaligenes]MBC9248742.1 L-asparaginase 1 [Pseudomonas alcaligenes]
MTPSQNLLVLYTGGTIGMQMSESGLAPASGFEARLRAEQAAHPERPVPSWRFRELSPPLDSANMTQAHWLAMRDAIVQAVDADGCDAVLLLHGTDTLAYSAAALSFLLLGLPVPLLLTGSMQPAGVAGSDAWANLFGALALLARGVAPGVHLYFNGQLLHGARASKLKSEAFDAFADHQRPRHGQRLAALPAALHYRQPRQPVRLAVQPLFPGLAAEQLRALLASGVQAVLLECYGSGTGPADNPEILAALREARARGVLLAAISQCPQGHVEFGVYAAGSALAGCGLVSGAGMGREAALGKLFSLLGAGLPLAEVERLLPLDLCGELAD